MFFCLVTLYSKYFCVWALVEEISYQTNVQAGHPCFDSVEWIVDRAKKTFALCLNSTADASRFHVKNYCKDIQMFSKSASEKKIQDGDPE